MNDYFIEKSKFDEEKVRRRFRMSKQLFLRILEDVKNNDRLKLLFSLMKVILMAGEMQLEKLGHLLCKK